MKRICVIGAGRWGRFHVKTLQEMECLAGIVEADAQRREELRATVPEHVSLFSSVQEAVDTEFDGYTVATPASTHFEIAKFLLERRLPVLVEKPIALSARDARELRQLSIEQRTSMMVGHVLLFHPAIRKIKELVAEGTLGKLQYIYSNRLNLGTVRSEENILWSFAPHDIAIFQDLIGTKPEEVTSGGGAFLQPHVHDTTLTVLRYPDNVQAHIFVSWLHPYKEHKMVLIGSKGMIAFEDSSKEKELLFFEKGIDFVQGEPIKRDGATNVIPYEGGMPLTEEMRYFVEHLEDGVITRSGPDNAVEVLEILERATESLLPSNGNAGSPSESQQYFADPRAVVDQGANIGEGTKVWHFAHVCSGAKIGKNCSIGQNVFVAPNASIGNNVKIQNNVSVYEGVTLEDYVFCGPSMVFTNILDPRCKYPQRGSEFYKKTLVREGASIGANATIVCGTTIGRHAFVGAGAVVTNDVPDYAMVLGVPGRVAGWVCECGQKLAMSDGKPEATCAKCGVCNEIAEAR